jgi:hypothetical protein
MTKGLVKSAAATAAATLVVERIATSILKESKKQQPAHGTAPIVEQAVQQLLAPPSKDGKTRKTSAKKTSDKPSRKKSRAKKPRSAARTRARRGAAGVQSTKRKRRERRAAAR